MRYVKVWYLIPPNKTEPIAFKTESARNRAYEKIKNKGDGKAVLYSGIVALDLSKENYETR